MNDLIQDKRVYISGPMEMYSGSGYNRDEFDRVERQCIELGAKLVVNPADLIDKVTSGAITREQAMEHDLRNLLMCDTVVMLDGWGVSDGAMLEWMVAKDTGKEIVTEWVVANG